VVAQLYPEPPLERLTHGAAWEVVLEAVVTRRAVRSWAEAWRGPPAPRPLLVLVTAPWREWPHNARWAGWWRSRLLVGDLSLRSQDAILTDFRTLLRQTPPVRRNWQQNLSFGRYEGVSYHLTWVRQVTVLV